MPREPQFPARRFTLPASVPPQRLLRWVAIGALVVVLTVLFSLGMGGITEVRDHEVAVFVNYLTGTMEHDELPGNKIYFPFIQQVFKLDKRTNKFVMEGKTDVDTDHVRELTVRARDGSNFWFDSIEIQYQLKPSDADKVLHDSGTGDAFKKFWLMTYARSVLRDEFGKFDPEEISNPAHYASARVKAQERLNTVLGEHGIVVTQITTPKPKFADEYEKAIEDRKLAEQDAERLKAMALQLQKEREKRLAEIESTKGQEFAALTGTLIAGKAQAEAAAIKLRREADAYKIQRTGEGEAERLAKIEEARGLVERNTKEGQGLMAKTEALARQGRWVVVEALAEKLANVKIEVIPYQRSEAPARLEVEQGAAIAPASASIEPPPAVKRSDSVGAAKGTERR